MNLGTQKELIEFFEGLNDRIADINDMKSFGEMKVFYNPDKITYATDLPAKSDVGVNFIYSDWAFFVIQFEKQLGQPLTFYVSDKLGEDPSFIVTTWHCAILPDESDLVYRDTLDHSLILSWSRFLDGYISNRFSGSRAEQTYEKLVNGRGIPVSMIIPAGIDLMDAWIGWMEKHTGHPQKTSIATQKL